MSFIDYFYEIKNTCYKYNKELLNKKPDLASKENLCIIISECLIEDIETVIELKRKIFAKRYSDSIIRNMAEQTIEFKYIMKHNELINQYYGGNLKDEEEIQQIDYKSLSTNDMLKFLKETGQARFDGGKRVKVWDMADDIKETKSSPNKISLYDIFSLKAELEHNCYFNSIFEEIDVIEGENRKFDIENDTDFTFIKFIMEAFMRTYKDLVDK